MDFNPKNFSCKFCERTFYTQIGFRFHIKTHHEESTPDSPSQEKSLKESSKCVLKETEELTETTKYVTKEIEDLKEKSKFEAK